LRVREFGTGALAMNREVAAVAQATVAADLDQALDVHLHFAAQVALDLVVGRYKTRGSGLHQLRTDL